MNKPYDLETVPCPLCGWEKGVVVISNAKELYNGLNEYFSVEKCPNCEMAYTNPRPTEQTMSYFYPNDAGYYKPKVAVDKILTDESSDLFNFLGSGFGYSMSKTNTASYLFWAKRWYLHRKSKLLHIPYWAHGGKLLDIGCSWGRYLRQMESLGWEVHGIEYNPQSVIYARESLGLTNVYEGRIEDIHLPDEKFDVVHMSMVLEHTHQPRSALLKLQRTLKQGGQLIVSVPDFSGIEFRLFGRYCYALQVPQHLNYFTPVTLKKMLSEAGFVIESVTHQNVDRDLIASLSYSKKYIMIYKLLKNRIIRKYLVRPFVITLALLGCTSRMSVYARKA